MRSNLGRLRLSRNVSRKSIITGSTTCATGASRGRSGSGIGYRCGTGNREPGTGNRERGTGNEEPEIRVSDVSPGAGWDQDSDTLDTWFSSGLWTFSTLGWPDEKEWNKNRAYHPTAVLETGYDILFFWIARMVLMSAYALGEVPFRDVYLH